MIALLVLAAIALPLILGAVFLDVRDWREERRERPLPVEPSSDWQWPRREER